MEKKVLATIGEKEITNFDVESILGGLDPYQAAHFNSEEGKKQILDDLVNQELLYIEAKENNLEQDEEFQNELKRVKEKFMTLNEQQFTDLYHTQGLVQRVYELRYEVEKGASDPDEIITLVDALDETADEMIKTVQ